MYRIKDISPIISNHALLANGDATIEHLLIDSRKLVFPGTSLFFALETQRNNGAKYIGELFDRGVRNFVVQPGVETLLEGANYLVVPNALQALQQLAAWHRGRFRIPVIAITGSNGKTMVKEWLYQLLQYDYNIVRSPRSYNSQVGVPLSVWQMNSQHTLAIFEAGISQPGEMEHLQRIIQPNIGVLTNIGEAHSEAFNSLPEKLAEKLLLFKQVEQFVYCKDCNVQLQSKAIQEDRVSQHELKTFSWGTLARADLNIQQTTTQKGSTTIEAVIAKTGSTVHITIPFSDKASIDNAITCWCVLLLLGYNMEAIRQKMAALQPLEMRMQLKKGINNCILINDSYNNDLSSLELALDYLSQQSSSRKKTIILSDIIQSGQTVEQLIRNIQLKTRHRNIDRLILIGPLFFANAARFNREGQPPVATQLEFYSTTDEFLQQSNTHHFKDEVILLKGARMFEFEQISHWLEEKLHQTVCEVNLSAMIHNLKEYQKWLNPGTRIMAMVKAFSYGSGSAEVALALQYHKADYLAVAYTDEGVDLRKAGIHMPIMVMNPEPITFDLLVEHNLEPEIYSPSILVAFDEYLGSQGIPQYPVHLKLDTGMHRLGFDKTQINQLLELLQNSRHFAVKSVFSHLVASENPAHDEFTRQQAEEFEEGCRRIEAAVGHPFLKHLSNTAGIQRHLHLQYDMVRLGIGLYGVETSSNGSTRLQPVVTLKSTIAQLRWVKKGETVGYGRAGLLTHDALIATVRIGYADGFNRRLGNGAGKVWIRGKLAPVTGNVCMDMIMVNVTGIEGVQEGDEVEIFGTHLPVKDVAAWANTIAYEILTGISQRVKRVYYEE